MSRPVPVQKSALVHLKRLPQRSEPSAASRPPLLVLLHGLGGSETALFEHASSFDQRFVVLSARGPLVWGPDSYAWFTARFTDEGPAVNTKDLYDSRERLMQLIAEAATTYQANLTRVYLLGYSQGAILALTLALTAPHLLAGVVACAGRIPQEVLPWAVTPEQSAGLPVLLLHGRADKTLPLHWARRARATLEGQRMALDYREYDAGHALTSSMLEDAIAWLSARLDASPRLAS
jgi:phospholipase/carboxylesterase